MKCPNCQGPTCNSELGAFCYQCQKVLTFSNVPLTKDAPPSPLEAIYGSPKSNKYRNTPCDYKGLHFDSAKELRDWKELELREAAGEISRLKHHGVFHFYFGEEKEENLICTYEADACYYEGKQYIVQDTKSPITRKDSTYRLKKRMMKLWYDIDIREV